MWEMLPILLSIGLFFITLIVIFTLRSADRRDRRLDIMRRYVTQYMTEVKHSEAQMRETVAEIDGHLAKSRQEMEALVRQVTVQREGLLAHSEDLDELQKTLTYYHQVLGQLSAMTEKAELRTRQVKDEVTKVGLIQDTIAEFTTRTGESEARMQQITEALDRAVGYHDVRMKKQIEESVAEAKIAINQLLDETLIQTDVTFQTMITTVQAFLRELNDRTELLEGVVKRLTTTSFLALEEIESTVEQTKKKIEEYDQNLVSIAQKRGAMEGAIEQLTQRKEEVEAGIVKSSELLAGKEQALKVLEQQVQTIQDELDMALAERQRLVDEEERRELEIKSRLDNPDVYAGEVDSEDIVPIFVAPEEELEQIDDKQNELGEDEQLELEMREQLDVHPAVAQFSVGQDEIERELPKEYDLKDVVPNFLMPDDEQFADELEQFGDEHYEPTEEQEIFEGDVPEESAPSFVIANKEHPIHKLKKIDEEQYELEEDEEEIILDDDSDLL